MIDIEFYGHKYRNVTDAWNVYRDHLNHFPQEDENQQASWRKESAEHLTKLLISMGQSLGYHFDEVNVKRALYYPQAHAQVEEENFLIRSGLIRLLHGATNLKMDIESFPMTPEELSEQKNLRDELLELLKGKRRLHVDVSNPKESKNKTV